MIIDLSVSNFRSFLEDQMFSMNVESARDRHMNNYTSIEGGRYGVLRAAAILGANASGKTNLLYALLALKWLVRSSSDRKEGQRISPYEPFRLSEESRRQPINFEVEFVVPSGVRYRYEVAFSNRRILEERLYSFARRAKALVFDRGPDDTWETIKFGSTYRGGNRRFPFFSNAAYLSRAGNDASSPEFIREIYRYFGSITSLSAGDSMITLSELADEHTLRAVSELICLADTGVERVTIEENEAFDDVKFPEGMPEDLKEAIIFQNRMAAKFWVKSYSGKLVSFDSVEMSDGTNRLVQILPVILDVLHSGSVLTFDEIDAHFHTDIVELILRLFQDEQINRKGAQIIFTTHDTNVLNSSILRRDQIWFVSKERGASHLKSLDEYDKKYVRHNSPFESFYRDGRLGALPRLSYSRVKSALVRALSAKDAPKNESADA